MSQTQTQHTDSIQVDDNNEPPKKQKSRRPANTAFRQQRLKAWQPILTPKTVLPIFFAVGIIFAPIGGLLLWASATVQEIAIDYTNCGTQAPEGPDEWANIPSDKVSSSFRSSNSSQPARWQRTTETVELEYGVDQDNTTVCTLQFNVPNNMGSPVYLFYRLTNFYQNHRRYVKSLDLNQLKGQFVSNSSIESGACNPLKTNNSIAYYPCGLIANSIFNDTIQSPTLVSSSGGQEGLNYSMTTQGIAWQSDLQLYGTTQYTNYDVLPPPNWRARYPDGYTDANPIPDLSRYEEFAVWMRTAGLPTFSKLARRNDRDPMPAGTYQIQIYDFFDVTSYGGTKSLLLSTRTVMGGKNDFLGIAYIVVGGLCIILGVFFTVAHLFKPRKLGDHTYLSWNNDSAPSATTTSRDTGR